MKQILFAMIIAVAATAQASETLVSKGEVFDKEGKNKKWTYERYQKIEGNAVFDRAVYKDLEGEILTEEKMHRVDGKLVRYDMSQKQLKQEAWIELKNDKVTFNLKKYRKRNYPQTVSKPDNFVVGLMLVPTMVKNWDKFEAGKEVEIKLGVWHRQEAITFDLSKESSNDKELVVKMNPSSMFIRAVVDPIYFHFDKTTKNLTKYRGRATPKEQRGRSYYDFDGLVTYKTMAAAAPKNGEKKSAKKATKKK